MSGEWGYFTRTQAHSKKISERFPFEQKIPKIFGRERMVISLERFLIKLLNYRNANHPNEIKILEILGEKSNGTKTSPEENSSRGCPNIPKNRKFQTRKRYFTNLRSAHSTLKKKAAVSLFAGAQHVSEVEFSWEKKP